MYTVTYKFGWNLLCPHLFHVYSMSGIVGLISEIYFMLHNRRAFIRLIWIHLLSRLIHFVFTEDLLVILQV